ncbi:hypothetical protein K6U52_06985 [Vibrio vulnificus]|uniref:hypothetical protein n=1 Tax=Vibrio vulnificus TaxID=672 RepID=UPI001EEA4E7F|nr:hypothetical protein [Vibrio vulnificus]MCG6313017.1 hypothetical protein [Vibrio vulnificus]
MCESVIPIPNKTGGFGSEAVFVFGFLDHATTPIVVISESSRIKYTTRLIVIPRLAFDSCVIERDHIAITIFSGKTLLVKVEITVVTKQVYKALLTFPRLLMPDGLNLAIGVYPET